MNELHATQKAISLSRQNGEGRSRLGIFVLCGLLLLGGIGYAGARGLRHERREARRLCERVEVADAPGEPVLVDSWMAWKALCWMASADVKKQLIDAHGDAHGAHAPAAALEHGEVIVVAAPGDSLLRRFRASGFNVSPAVEPATGAAGEFGGVRIFFAAAPVGRWAEDGGGTVSSKPSGRVGGHDAMARRWWR